MARTQDEIREARVELWERFPIGSTVTTKLTHVSRSGMTRLVEVYANGERGPENITGLVAAALNGRIDSRRGGIVVSGCGFSATFDVVYRLGRALYRDAFYCMVERACPSNDHTNERFDEEGYWRGRVHSDPGYALKHREI